MGKGGSEDFADAHCDEYVGEGAGQYGHELIPLSETAEVEVEGTSAFTLHSAPAGLNVTVTASAVSGTGWIENTAVETEEATDHRVTGHVSLELSGFTAEGTIKKCDVHEPVEVTADLESAEDPASGTMGVKFSESEEGESGAFTQITLEGCALAGTYPLNGNMVATGAATEGLKGSGATFAFFPGSPSHESLVFFGAAATLEGGLMTRLLGGDAVALTTVTEGTTPPAEGITAFACAEGAGKEDFADPHCDEGVAAASGEYGHESLAAGKATEIEVTNEGTEHDTTDSADAVFEATVVGVKAKITATKVRGTGQIENLEPETGVHALEGEVAIQYTKLHVDEPAGCEVAEPLEVPAAIEAVEVGESVGIELTPLEGTTFASITFEGEECALDGITASVKGSAVATGGAGEGASTGATAVLEPAHESLAVGKAAASLTSTITVKMAGGDPLTLTRIE